jgi:putative transposase
MCAPAGQEEYFTLVGEQVANRPFYAAVGVSLAGERDILGLWAGSVRGSNIRSGW